MPRGMKQRSVSLMTRSFVGRRRRRSHQEPWSDGDPAAGALSIGLVSEQREDGRAGAGHAGKQRAFFGQRVADGGDFGCDRQGRRFEIVAGVGEPVGKFERRRRTRHPAPPATADCHAAPAPRRPRGSRHGTPGLTRSMGRRAGGERRDRLADAGDAGGAAVEAHRHVRPDPHGLGDARRSPASRARVADHGPQQRRRIRRAAADPGGDGQALVQRMSSGGRMHAGIGQDAAGRAPQLRWRMLPEPAGMARRERPAHRRPGRLSGPGGRDLYEVAGIAAKDDEAFQAMIAVGPPPDDMQRQLTLAGAKRSGSPGDRRGHEAVCRSRGLSGARAGLLRLGGLRRGGFGGGRLRFVRSADSACRRSAPRRSGRPRAWPGSPWRRPARAWDRR